MPAGMALMTTTLRLWMAGFFVALACGGKDDGGTAGTTSGAGSDTTSAPGTTGNETAGAPTTDGPQDPALFDLCTAYFELNRTWTCGCAADQAACEEENLGTPDGLKCSCEIAAAHPETEATYTCRTPHAEAFVACLEPYGCAYTPEQLMACADAFATAVGECPNDFFPGAESAAKCYGSTDVFLCPSGDYIFDLLVCDGRDDCPDGADEANC